MLMALRFVLARLFSARRPLLVPAAVAPVAEQMHADEQDEKHNPNPVLH
jgi:hypothetical protein